MTTLPTNAPVQGFLGGWRECNMSLSRLLAGYQGLGLLASRRQMKPQPSRI